MQALQNDAITMSFDDGEVVYVAPIEVPSDIVQAGMSDRFDQITNYRHIVNKNLFATACRLVQVPGPNPQNVIQCGVAANPIIAQGLPSNVHSENRRFTDRYIAGCAAFIAYAWGDSRNQYSTYDAACTGWRSFQKDIMEAVSLYHYTFFPVVSRIVRNVEGTAKTTTMVVPYVCLLTIGVPSQAFYRSLHPQFANMTVGPGDFVTMNTIMMSARDRRPDGNAQYDGGTEVVTPSDGNVYVWTKFLTTDPALWAAISSSVASSPATHGMNLYLSIFPWVTPNAMDNIAVQRNKTLEDGLRISGPSLGCAVWAVLNSRPSVMYTGYISSIGDPQRAVQPSGNVASVLSTPCIIHAVGEVQYKGAWATTYAWPLVLPYRETNMIPLNELQSKFQYYSTKGPSFSPNTTDAQAFALMFSRDVFFPAMLYQGAYAKSGANLFIAENLSSMSDMALYANTLWCSHSFGGNVIGTFTSRIMNDPWGAGHAMIEPAFNSSLFKEVLETRTGSEQQKKGAKQNMRQERSVKLTEKKVPNPSMVPVISRMIADGPSQQSVLSQIKKKEPTKRKRRTRKKGKGGKRGSRKSKSKINPGEFRETVNLRSL